CAAREACEARGAVRNRVTSWSRQPRLSERSALTTAFQPPAGCSTSRVCRSLSGRQSASVCKSISSRVIVSSSGCVEGVGAVEGKRGRVAFEERVQMLGPAPDLLDVGQGFGGLVEPQLHPRVNVLEQQLAAIAIIAVYYIDPRFPEVSQAE